MSDLNNHVSDSDKPQNPSIGRALAGHTTEILTALGVAYLSTLGTCYVACRQAATADNATLARLEAEKDAALTREKEVMDQFLSHLDDKNEMKRAIAIQVVAHVLGEPQMVRLAGAYPDTATANYLADLLQANIPEEHPPNDPVSDSHPGSHQTGPHSSDPEVLKDARNALSRIIDRAIRENLIEVLQVLIRRDVHRKLVLNASPLFLAADCADVEVIDLLLTEGGFQANEVEKRFLYSPLHFAAKRDAPKVVELFLAQPGVIVDAADSRGQTPLMLAAGKGHLEVIRILLNHHADPERRNTDGQSASELAANNGQDKARLLLDNWINSRRTHPERQ